MDNSDKNNSQTIPESKHGRGKITTIVDLVDRDHQDNYLFPLDTDQSWFMMEPRKKGYPVVRSFQEFPAEGTPEWGGRLEFVFDRFSAGDLLQDFILQFRMQHWYHPRISVGMDAGYITILDSSSNTFAPWTFANSLGSIVISYAEIKIDGVLIEHIDGEFITVFYDIYKNVNNVFGIHSDLTGLGSNDELANNTGMFSPSNPFPVESGKFICVLPFFFSRVRNSQTLPIISCKDRSIRIIIQLRPFNEVVRLASMLTTRSSCMDTPLNKRVRYTDLMDISEGIINNRPVQSTIPQLKDVQVVTGCFFVSESLRTFYLNKPFEQVYNLVQTFRFDEPIKYTVSKPNPIRDIIDIQIPLELNHPVEEIFWVFRRKAVEINNEWCNFSPFTYNQLRKSISNSADINIIYADWLEHASIVLNGVVLQEAEGERFRYQIAKSHSSGIISLQKHIYGYSFSLEPELHHPEGTANMSRVNSIVLNMSVRPPFPVDAPDGFNSNVSDGWEIFIFAIYHNWLRFENGICNRVFID